MAAKRVRKKKKRRDQKTKKKKNTSPDKLPDEKLVFKGALIGTVTMVSIMNSITGFASPGIPPVPACCLSLT